MTKIIIILLIVFWFISSYSVSVTTTNSTINQIANLPLTYKLFDVLKSMISNKPLDQQGIIQVSIIKS